MDLIVFVGVFVLFWINYSFAQTGNDCTLDSDCSPHQTCHFGYCRCDVGYVKNIHHCFQLRRHGEDCYFFAQCQDFRMVCEAQGADEIKRCHCDKYHEWNITLNQCVTVANFTDILQTMQEEVKWAEDIEKEGARVFFWQRLAGLVTVTSVGVFLFILCLTAACCNRRGPSLKTGDSANEKVEEVASMGSPQGTYVPIPTDLSQPSSSAFVLPIS